MGWFRTLMSWRDAPIREHGSTREAQSRPLSFQLDVPPDLLRAWTVDGALSPRVERALAMSVPAVKRVRDLIAGTLGTLPVKVHNRRRQVVPNALLEQPEVDVARSVTMTRTVEDMLFEGRSWWRITAYGWDGFPAQVRRLEPRSVTVRRNSKVYVSSEDGHPQGQAWEWVPDAELIRIDSPNDPLLTVGARAIRAAIALDRAAARYADEPLPLGYFAPRDGVDPGDRTEIEDVLDEWEDARRRRAWGYVGAALEARTLQWNPEQLQLAAARDYTVLEIARLGGVDPEELGVSTTSRTYANAEQRRLDLLDFTLLAYVAAMETRLSMNDVLPRGQFARVQYAGFLRSDTLTRMQVYQLGREVGVYDDERIAELEDIPSARPQPAPSPAAEDRAPASTADVAAVAQAVADRLAAPIPQSQEDTVPSMLDVPAVRFTAMPPEPLTIGFAVDAAGAQFRVDSSQRTVSGLAVPWNVVARSMGSKWKFAAGSVHWADESRVKLDRDHLPGSELGRAIRLNTSKTGLDTSFKIARGPEGDRILELAEDGVYDGFSVFVDFSAEGDGWTADPQDDSVRLVHSATLRKVAITAMPAFDQARVTSVAATRETEPLPMTGPSAPAAPTAPTLPASPAPAASPAPTVPAAAPPAAGSAGPPPADLAAFTAGVSEAVAAGVAEAFAQMGFPQGPPPPRQVIPAGRVQVTREAPVYTMDGRGPSLVRDSWRARIDGDAEAQDRLATFRQQTRDAADQALNELYFGASTGTHGAIIPPGYRPDLYVTQLMQGRPLVMAVQRGAISDATPFTVPRFVSMAGMTSDHVEGTNPTDGTLVVDTITVTPGAVSGLFTVTREIVDSSNPAIDMIATTAMLESYSQQTEDKVYAELNGPDGQGGVITDGFVPSGAQVATTTGGSAGAGTFGGAELIAGIRKALALYPFRRFAAPNRAHLSQEGTTALATAVDGEGRPLLPSIGAQNSAGVGNSVTQGWFVDGLPHQATWSMTGNAAVDADVLTFNSNDVWAWESPLLTFRFEERGGPANIDLALFGYFATRILRPVGLTAIRHTVGA